MNGKVTKMVASRMPGSAKMILMSCAASHAPNRPCSPNSSTKTRPAMTGETENGRSISVMRIFLPQNSNFAMAQAAARPKALLSRTELNATSKVRWIAERVLRRQRSGEIRTRRLDFKPIIRVTVLDDSGPGFRELEHDPEKCEPVFGKDHAQTKSWSLTPIRPRTMRL